MLRISIFISLLMTGATALAAKQNGTFRVMGFNFWGPFFGNPVEERESTIADVIERYSPNVLAIQEMHPDFWRSQLPKRLSAAGLMTINPASDGHNNWIPLFYSSNRLDLIECGFERFCPRLDESKSVT